MQNLNLVVRSAQSHRIYFALIKLRSNGISRHMPKEILLCSFLYEDICLSYTSKSVIDRIRRWF